MKQISFGAGYRFNTASPASRRPSAIVWRVEPGRLCACSPGAGRACLHTLCCKPEVCPNQKPDLLVVQARLQDSNQDCMTLPTNTLVLSMHNRSNLLAFIRSVIDQTQKRWCSGNKVCSAVATHPSGALWTQVPCTIQHSIAKFTGEKFPLVAKSGLAVLYRGPPASLSANKRQKCHQ